MVSDESSGDLRARSHPWNPRLTLLAVRSKQPVVQCLTNAVSMGRVADALAAFGARPVMASAVEEASAMVQHAEALLLNLGTPTAERWAAARQAGRQACRLGLPVVVDPVGCGSTEWRTRASRQLVRDVRPSVVRGSAPEIAALAELPARGARLRGVAAEEDAALDASSLAYAATRALGCPVLLTGRVDSLSDGIDTVVHRTDVLLLERVVGAGDVLGALIAACCAVESDALRAAWAGLVAFAHAAHDSAARARGPATFWVDVLDILAATPPEGCLEPLDVAWRPDS
jgi:hydroxyethylthiazole kinase